MSRRASQPRSVIALAGRRVDAENTQAPRFPMRTVDRVRAELRDVFRKQRADALVCSAACGSDLLALDVAGALGMERRIILPYDTARFRNDSVTDRPGDWGPLFDQVCAEAQDRDNLVIMHLDEENEIGWDKANEVIIEEALSLAKVASASPDHVPHIAIGVVVWDGAPWGEADITAAFVRHVKQRGLRLYTISTMRP